MRALLRIFPFANTIRSLFYKEPSSRPSSKSSLFLDILLSNLSTKSSLIFTAHIVP